MNKGGGLEGLPLYLIILIVLAAVVLVGLLALVPRPIVVSRMAMDPDTMCWDRPAVVSITVFSSDSRPINDATVELDGPSIALSEKTHDGGRVFAHVTPHTANPNPGLGSVTVEAKFGGVTVVDSIPVSPCAPTTVANREEALAVVFTSVVHPEEYANVEIFAMEAPLQSGQRIETSWDDATQGPKLVANVDGESFLFFVDPDPGVRFEHPVHIALVGTADGEVTSFEERWPPMIDGEERWLTRESRETPGELVFSQGSSPAPVPPAGRGQSMEPLGQTTPSYCRPQDTQKWALAISASDDVPVNPQETENFAQLLRTYGYDARSLQPSTMPNGWQTIQAAFAGIRQSILATSDGGYCDEFVLIWGGHGSEDGWVRLDYGNGSLTQLRGTQIADEVDRATESIRGMQVRVLIDTCFSGLQHEIYWTTMPPDSNANAPDKIFRDVYVMTAVNPYHLAAGSTRPVSASRTLTVLMMQCITSQQKVDWGAAFACAKPQYWGMTIDYRPVQSAQDANWWNDGT